MAAPGERCRTCGASLSPDARVCTRCGRTTRAIEAPTVVELVPDGAPPRAPAGGATEHRATVALQPPDRRRMVGMLGAVVAGVLVVLALTALVDDGRDDAAPVPTTAPVTADATTTDPPTSAVPSTTVAATTSTSPVTTTTNAFVNQQPGVVLDDSQRDRSLFLATGNTLFRVDLATGRVTTRAGLGGLIGSQVAVVDGRVLLVSSSVTSLAADLAGDPEFVIPPSGFGALSPSTVQPSGLWFARYSAAGTDLVRLDRAGRTMAEVRVPTGLFFSGVLDDRIVVAQGGRIWTIGGDQVLRPFATGAVAAVSGRHLLWLGCDEAGRCTYRLGTATTPDTRRTSLDGAFLATGGEPGGFGNALAPDGASLVAWLVQNNGTPAIVDLATGAATEPPDRGAAVFAWSPDGRWLVSVNGTIVTALDVRTGARRTLLVPGFTGVAPTGVAIG